MPPRLLRLLLCVLLCLPLSVQAETLYIAAASSLQDVLRALRPGFEHSHPGVTLSFQFGASDELLRQLGAGSRADLFASADAELMLKALTLGLVREDGARRAFASNELVLVTLPDLPLQKLGQLLEPRIKRVAIGNPGLIPAGRYAKEGLERAGLWAAVQPKLVYADQVREVLDLVLRAEVDAGLVYRSELQRARGQLHQAAKLPTATPIRFWIAASRASQQTELARAYVDYLMTPTAQTLLRRHGFGPP